MHPPRPAGARLTALLGGLSGAIGNPIGNRVRGLALVVPLVLAGCALPGFRGASPSEAALRERSEVLEREVALLRADLEQAEQTIVAIESGLRGVHTRADAVSALAEARIEVERVASLAPWSSRALDLAKKKLEEGDLQLQAGHFGSAIFFASRAEGQARTALEQAELFARPGSLYVRVPRVNVRKAPSTDAPVVAVALDGTPVRSLDRKGSWVKISTPDGAVGWVHTSLLDTHR